MLSTTRMIKTSFCIISDTHATALLASEHSSRFYRNPLPSSDVLLHCGDITQTGQLEEYRTILDVLKTSDAEFKLVIAGNHDVSLDAEYLALAEDGERDGYGMEGKLSQVRRLWNSPEARAAGIVYLEEGTRTFSLKNGAQFTIYTSPYTPEYCDWGFAYPRTQDRFNPPGTVLLPPISVIPFFPESHERHNISAALNPTAPAAAVLNPIPAFPAIDIMMTHGPPFGILDQAVSQQSVGCEYLLGATRRARPRMHCFGHIHEAWGGLRYNWPTGEWVLVSVTDWPRSLKERSVRLDVSKDASLPLRFGEETLFINAAIMDVHYEPRNAPWVIHMDLPAEGARS